MPASITRPRLSIVAPCHNEEEGLDLFCRRVAAAAAEACCDAYEIILVDDGSTDGTWEKISALSRDHEAILGVRLLRNHGHQLAATAGLATARGERVLLIDADLQDPPELLLMMMAIMDRGADVVYGQRQRRQGETWFKLTSASAFYRLLSRLSSVAIPRDTGDFRLMNRRVVDILLSMPERERFIRGMVSWIGGKQVALPYERDPRYAGETKYSLRKMVSFALDAITSFSTVPLRVATWLGLITAMVALALLVFTLASWLIGHTVTGWASLMAAITTFSAIQLIGLGVIGEYLGRLVQEHKGRPMFMVEAIIRHGDLAELPVDFASLPPQAKREAMDAATVDKTAQRKQSGRSA
ncbi:glycosyltransferase family 2 protein [Rhizobium paknamense]|uniref:Dolichol-phosphate mannosyltransferase n=1 Tax=Rhizobium paknamense TaxID=1206817 RepID=A0ABU0IF81_9HYPH|nr:glycosyltransferase family 2 protein [Rhizobium paknamense]MDQ0456367.1 dolichol-phosphate mannosyltransferase [Rhizobium paknamense]